MPLWLVITLSVATVIYALSRVNVYIDLQYKRDGDNDQVVVNVYLLRRFLVYKLRVPVIEISKKAYLPWVQSELHTAGGKIKTHSRREKQFVVRLLQIYLKHPDRWEKLMTRFRQYRRMYVYFICELTKQLHCEQLRLHVRYGAEDAAVTGVMIGAFWAITGWGLYRLRERLIFRNRPEVFFEPRFGKTCLAVDFACIFRLPIGHVISTSLSLANYTRKGEIKDG